MKVKVRDAILGTKKVSYIKKDGLYLSKCDCCGKLFDMERITICDQTPGVLSGVFDVTPEGMGNMFEADVCSLKCAHELFIGGWKKIKEYRVFSKRKAKLEIVKIAVTRYIRDDEEAITVWDKSLNIITGLKG